MTTEADSEDREDADPIHPFFSVASTPGGRTRVKAGWMTQDGDIDYLVLDAADIPANRVEQAFSLAFGWYVDQLNHLAQPTQADSESSVERVEDPAEATE